MPLSEALERHLDRADASGFQLAGEGLWLLTGADLRRAAREYDERLATIPLELRARVESEHQAFGVTAWRWLERYNKSLEDRLKGYLAIGRALSFEYPWPVIAVLGVLTVRGGVRQSEGMRLLGAAIPGMLEVGDWMQDVLRRTNRGIFADSVPTTLLAVRCHALRESGEAPLAEALLSGPHLPAMDDESQSLARALYQSLAVPNGAARFRALVELTLKQFDREQAIFTAQIGARRGGAIPVWPERFARVTRLKSVDAPRIEAQALKFRSYPLPAGFDIRNHRARTERFGHAFVTAVTGTIGDYKVAVEEVMKRYGRSSPPRFDDGIARLPAWAISENP